MGKSKRQHTQLIELYRQVESEILNERINSFVEFHGRIPSLTEEMTEWERISKDEIKLRFKQLTHVDADEILQDPTQAEEYNHLTAATNE